MFSKINKKLLPFKFYYFFKVGGSCFIQVFPVIARQKGVPDEGVGLVWTVTPFTSAAVNVLFGTIADKFRIHRLLLVILSTIMSICMTAYFLLPKVSINYEITEKDSLYIHCTDNDNIYMACNQKYIVSNLENVTFWNDEDILDTAKEIKSCDVQCEISANVMDDDNGSIQKSSSNLQSLAISIPYESLSGSKECIQIKDSSVFPIGNIPCDAMNPMNCSNSCFKDDVNNNTPLVTLFAAPEFWLLFFCVIISQGCFISSTSLGDTLCQVALGNKRHNFGKQRLFGAMGLGLMALIGGALVNTFSKGKPETDYTAAIVITASFQIIGIIIIKWINVKVPEKQSEASSLGDVLRSIRFWLLEATVVVTGLAYGIIWPFKFIYINEVAIEWDPTFSDGKLLQGLLLFVDSFIVEVLFYFFSGRIIKKLTSVHTFSLSLTATSARLLLYSITTNPWLFIPIHFLHGLSLGVFTANMITSTGEMAPRGAHATLQSYVSTTFTLGRSLGALLGGISIRNLGGSKTFFIWGAFVSSYTVLYILYTCFIWKNQSVQKPDDNRGDYENANEPERTNQEEAVEQDATAMQEFGSIHQL